MSDLRGDTPFALARKASGAAQRRLRDAHPEEYIALVEEERRKRGLPPMNGDSLRDENIRLRKELDALRNAQR